MATTIKNSLSCLVTLISIAISIFNFQTTEASGFSIDLIHRDSLKSHSLHSSETFNEIEATLQRSFRRAETLIGGAYSPQSTTADILPDVGEYLMRFGLGTPGVETLAIADTGSDLTWVQCSPCRQCYKQKAPLFVPNRSSTYKSISCHSDTCNSVRSTSCGRGGACGYQVQYGDRSYSQGDIATETLTLGSTAGKNVSIPGIIIGCGHVDQGTFSDGASGIVGLGGGRESLIRQLGSTIGGKFSYCLAPISERRRRPSKMHFGSDAVVSDAGAVKTPMVPKSPATFYYLTLEGISVGNQRFNLASSPEYESKYSREGNIIIDSGTTLTFLPGEIYRQVVTALKRQVRLKVTSDLQLQFCFEATEADQRKIPDMTAHFKGADVKLKPYNTFIWTTPRILCLAFAESDSLAIYGNLAQMNYLIGYDLERKTVSFKPADCSRA